MTAHLNTKRKEQYAGLLRPLTKAAIEATHLREDLLPLIHLGKVEMGSVATPTLRDRIIRLAFYTPKPDLKRVLTSALVENESIVKIAAYGIAFKSWVGKRKFHSPKTNNKIEFDSLEPETQKEIHEQWIQGRKQWAEQYKPQALPDDTTLTPSKYDALEPGDKLWVSYRPDHLHEVVAWDSTKGGKPTLKVKLVDRKTGEDAQPGKFRHIHRNTVGSPKHDIHVVPHGHDSGETPKVDWGGVDIEHEWEHMDPTAKKESEISKAPSDGKPIKTIEDLAVGDYFTMESPDGETNLMQVVQKGGVDVMVAPVHSELSVPLGVEPMSMTDLDFSHSPAMKIDPPKPKGGKAVKNTGDVSLGDYMTFGVGDGGKADLLKVKEHTGEYIHAVPINPRNGNEMGDTITISTQDLKQSKTWKVPEPQFPGKEKPEKKEDSGEDLDTLFSEVLGDIGKKPSKQVSPEAPKEKAKAKPTKKQLKALHELEEGHWVSFKSADGKKRFLHVTDTSGKHPQVTEYGSKGKKFHSYDLDDTQHQFLQDISGKLHIVDAPKWSEQKLKPHPEMGGEPPIPSLLEGISETPSAKPPTKKPKKKPKKQLLKALHELEAGHWVSFKSADGKKRFLHVTDSSGKHPKVTEYGSKGKKFHEFALDDAQHQFLQDISGKLHIVDPPKWSERKLKPHPEMEKADAPELPPSKGSLEKDISEIYKNTQAVASGFGFDSDRVIKYLEDNGHNPVEGLEMLAKHHDNGASEWIGGHDDNPAKAAPHKAMAEKYRDAAAKIKGKASKPSVSEDEPPMPSLMQGISEAAPAKPKTKPSKAKPAKPKLKHAPTGKHKTRPVLRGKPKNKLSDKSNFGSHSFVQSMLLPSSLSGDEKKEMQKQLEGSTYKDWEEHLKRLHFAKANSDHPVVKEFLEDHTMEDIDHLTHAIGRHLQDVHGRQYHSDVLAVANKHDLESGDADELRLWKQHHSDQAKPIWDIKARFLKHAKPETRKRMEGLDTEDFKKMYLSIMMDAKKEKTAALMRRIAKFYQNKNRQAA